jgi:hypothetical protein
VKLVTNHTVARQARGAYATVPDHVLSQEVGGEIVILDLESGTYYGLNEVASCIWLLIQRRSTLEEVIEALLEEYEADEATLRSDLLKCLKTLAEARLVSLPSEGVS